MKLYNTMTRTKEVVKPLSGTTLMVYTCGPTVYDYPQIGNWTAFIRWDMLCRTLSSSGYNARWIMNITDVGHLVSDADEGEDKLEKGARREGKSAWEVAEFYTADFLDGLDALRFKLPREHLKKATDAIPEQIALVQKLEDKGYTYVIDDGVYFDTSKLDDYGKLGRINLDALRAGERVAFNDQKRHKTDFALWKFTPSGQTRDMEWDSPWGKGFPGWHIECSALAMTHLADTIDIHAGGIDHIPVHHTNEIAQTEAATGQPFANIWLHSNFMTVDGVKFSKSLGNSYTLHSLTERGFDPLDFRLFALQSHYRSQADFSWESLIAARQRRFALRGLAELRYQPAAGYVDISAVKTVVDDVLESLQDDLDTPRALAALSRLDSLLDGSKLNTAASGDASGLTEQLQRLEELLGIGLLDSKDISKQQQVLLQQRANARTNKDWARADDLRDQLAITGLLVKDVAVGQIWSRMAPKIDS